MLVLVLISKCEQIEKNDLKTSAHYGEEEKHVCSIYIYTDPYLWSHIHFLEGKKCSYIYSMYSKKKKKTREIRENSISRICCLVAHPTIPLQIFTDKNSTATYQRIERIIKKNIEEANRVFNLAEFYGKGQNIHKGIEFKLTDYFIDTDEKCGPRKRL